ncbi:MAG TPA: IS3 family transposase [Acidimicrobiales bacterium]
MNRLGYSERLACQTVGLSRSTYYKIKHHRPTDGEIRRLLLADAIADIHARSRGTYGMLRVRAALEIEQGLIVNKKLVWKIMRQLGLKGLPGPRKGVKNLKNAPTCEDLVERRFEASAPNELWLTDITEHPTAEGKLYCCVVLDMCSRKVVGWAIDRRCEAAMVNDALAKASRSRSTSTPTVVHSDHGSQFTSWAFTEHVRRLGLISSMGTVGDCYDNAPIESFWGSMQIELLNRQRWRTHIELAVAIADYIEHFYNSSRRHSALGYLTPDEFEALHSPQPMATLS